jgi:hypothetical protein
VIIVDNSEIVFIVLDFILSVGNLRGLFCNDINNERLSITNDIVYSVDRHNLI